jgi:hypothetical protein
LELSKLYPSAFMTALLFTQQHAVKNFTELASLNFAVACYP